VKNEKRRGGGSNPMKSMLWSFLAVILVLIRADVAAADTVTYTFVGAGGTSGTSWTLVDPDGFLTVPSGNVISLVQTATDLILVDPMTGPEDFGPLTNIRVGNPPSEPDYYGIQLGSSSFTLASLFIPKADFTTPGTYDLADLVDLRNNLPADEGTLTIAATPEPSSLALMLSGLGLALMTLMRKRSFHRYW
jgi:PEP-CTERM motif